MKLTIVISSYVEDIKLIKLVDQSRNFINNGHLLIKPREDEKLQADVGSSHIMVVPLQSSKNVECKLELEIFCEFIEEKHLEVGKINSTRKSARIHYKIIHVPKYSMFTFVMDEVGKEKKTESETIKTEPSLDYFDCSGDDGEKTKNIYIKCSLKDESKAKLVS